MANESIPGFYVAADGSNSAIIAAEKDLGHDKKTIKFHFRPAGNTHFYELSLQSYLKNDTCEVSVCVDRANHGANHRIVYYGDTGTLEVDRKPYIRAPKPAEIHLLKAPSPRHSLFTFRTKDGILLHVTSDKAGEDIRLYMGEWHALRRLPVIEVIRNREGGSTLIITTEGQLYVAPRHYDQSAKSTWKPRGVPRTKVTHIDRKKVAITETEEGASMEYPPSP
jgi:hypothetical protein